MRYIHEAKIQVKLGRFPLDMLRYDCCYPASQEDAEAMAYYPDVKQAEKSIMVCKITDSKIDSFTPDRWRSFGCEIIISAIRKI